MNRQTVIVIITPDLQIECWGNLKKACKNHEWKYNTLSRKELPIEWHGYKIFRVRFN